MFISFLTGHLRGLFLRWFWAKFFSELVTSERDGWTSRHWVYLFVTAMPLQAGGAWWVIRWHFCSVSIFCAPTVCQALSQAVGSMWADKPSALRGWQCIMCNLMISSKTKSSKHALTHLNPLKVSLKKKKKNNYWLTPFLLCKYFFSRTETCVSASLLKYAVF